MPPPRLTGCYTALVTPMGPGGEIDWDGFRRLADFQAASGISGIVAVGTTGESSTLDPAERRAVIRECRERLPGSVRLLAGTGSSSTVESLRATREAGEAGASHALLVDPYYNAPSSLEIRREYYEPIARASPDLGIVPYVIPSRTGTRLEPADLALLAEACPNVVGVKEATGSDAYGREVRRLVRSEFSILSGDDARTSDLMRDPEVRAEGVISVLSNVFPGTLATWVEALRSGDGTSDGVASRVRALTPLLSLVTIETSEETPGGVVRVRARNPVPVKSMMRILGLPAGRCRPPLGRLTPGACTVVVDALRKANADCPELFDEIEAAFGVSVADRLADPPSWQGVAYDD